MMNRIWTRLVSAAALLLLLLTLSSCGSDAATGSADAPSNDAVAPTAEPVATTAPIVFTDDDVTADAVAEDHDTEDHDTEDHDTEDHDIEDHAHDETGAVIDYTGSYEYIDEQFGTMVSVTVDGDTRTIIANSLPDHETGEFPNAGNPNTISEQSVVLELTTSPVYVGDAEFALSPGIAVNGVTFEPGTAESVSCSSGETYRIEGLQDMFDLGMDFNNAHVQPTGKYHYHGISDLLVDNHDTDEDLTLIGFAADGFLMYYSKSGAYASSYQLSADARTGSDCTATGPAGGTAIQLDGTSPDGTYDLDWDYVAGAGDLDSCNGTEIDGQYAYVVTDEYPFVSRCLNGEFTGGGPGGGAGPGAGPGQGERPEGAAPAEGGAPPEGAAPAEGGAPPEGAEPPEGGAPPERDGAEPPEGGAPPEGDGAPAGGGQGAGGPGQGGGPDFSTAAEALGVTEDALLAALGGPPPDFEAAAATLGVTVAQLEAVLPAPPG